MRSNFIILAIVTVFEITHISSGAVVENGEETSTSDIHPEQMTKMASFAPMIVEAISELPSEKVAQTLPHLEALTNAFANTPLERIIAFMSRLCAHHDDLVRMRNAQRHMSQFLQQTAGRPPVRVQQKTKMTWVYGSDNDDDNVSASPQDRFRRIANNNGYAREVTTANNRIAQDTMQNLQRLQDSARAAQAQIEKEVSNANDLLRNQMQEANVRAMQELRSTNNAIRLEAQKMYVGLKKGFAWLREEMHREMQSINQEWEESKRAYKNNVEEFKSSIRNDLATANEAVQQQVAQVANQLQERFNSTTGQLDSQLKETRTQLNDEAQRASDAVSTQVQQIREKMQAAMDEMRAEMNNVDAELKQGIADASNGAKAVGPMNEQVRAETEKAIAEMKRTTQEMRDKMEKEIQNTVQALTTEIESILKEMRNAKNMEGLIPAAAGKIADTEVDSSRTKDPDDESKAKADSKVEETTQTAGESLQNAAEKRMEKDAGTESSSKTLQDAVASNKGDQKSSADSADAQNSLAGNVQDADEEEDEDEDFDLGDEDDDAGELDSLDR